MKTVRNVSKRPIAVPLPRGKKLHLAPGQSGPIAAEAVEHPPLVALLEAGDLEMGEEQSKSSGSHASGGRVHDATHGFHPPTQSGQRGDR